MKHKIINLWSRASLIFIFSYLLNFLWEAIHAYTLYQSHDFQASKYVPMLLYASLIDSLLICLIFFVGFLVLKRIIKANKTKEVVFILIAGFIISSIIELKALLFKQWSYNDIMPTIFGMGLSPLLQLPITGLISIFLAGKLFRK